MDIWSLAVILLEYIYNWPPKHKIPKLKNAVRRWGLDWCNRPVDTAQDWDSDVLIDFLTRHMLKLEPLDRLTAVECLRKGSQLGIFNEKLQQTGDVTPKSQPAPAAAVVDQEEDQSTIIMGPLWGEINNPSKYRRTSRQDRIPSLPALPPNEMDTYDSFDRMVSEVNRGMNQGPPAYTYTRVENTLVRCIKIFVRGHQILMHESDRSLNALQVLELIPSDAERQSIVKCIGERRDHETRSLENGFWVSFKTGKSLCQILSLEHDLQPLLDLEDRENLATDILPRDSEGRSELFQVEYQDRYVTIRRSDFHINATHILQVAGHNRHKINAVRMNHPDMKIKNAKGYGRAQGAYVSFLDGLLLCQEYQIPEVRQMLIQKFVDSIFHADSKRVPGQDPGPGRDSRKSIGQTDVNQQTYPRNPSPQSYFSQVYPKLGQPTPPSHVESGQEKSSEERLGRNALVQAPHRRGGGFVIAIDGIEVSLRIVDRWVNLTQLVSLICHRQPSLKPRTVMERIKKHRETTVHAPDQDFVRSQTWIGFNDASEVSKEYHLFEDLLPLFDLRAYDSGPQTRVS